MSLHYYYGFDLENVLIIVIDCLENEESGIHCFKWLSSTKSLKGKILNILHYPLVFLFINYFKTCGVECTSIHRNALWPQFRHHTLQICLLTIGKGNYSIFSAQIPFVLNGKWWAVYQKHFGSEILMLSRLRDKKKSSQKYWPVGVMLFLGLSINQKSFSTRLSAVKVTPQPQPFLFIWLFPPLGTTDSLVPMQSECVCVCVFSRARVVGVGGSYYHIGPGRTAVIYTTKCAVGFVLSHYFTVDAALVALLNQEAFYAIKAFDFTKKKIAVNVIFMYICVCVHVCGSGVVVCVDPVLLALCVWGGVSGLAEPTPRLPWRPKEWLPEFLTHPAIHYRGRESRLRVELKAGSPTLFKWTYPLGDNLQELS